ncbi:MAG: inositol monophosphatase family protein [Terriglobales bacterium]
MPERDFLTAAVAIARSAGAILLGHFGTVRVEYKGIADIVTAADRASEKFIVERLQAEFPDHAIVGEEGTRTESSSGFRWYIDPLDGTTNFAHGLPLFAVSMGLEYHGKLIAGVVYNPADDTLYTAARGRGAQCNGNALHVSPIGHLSDSLLATGFPSPKRTENPNIYFYQAITLRSHGVRRLGSAALDLCFVASGRFQGFWEFHLNSWDVAAGALIVEEAGGRLSDMLGQPFQMDSPEAVASNGHIHDEMLAAFRSVFEATETPALPSPASYYQRRMASRSSR